MADLEGTTYTAEIAFDADPVTMPATCGDCSWRGEALECSEIEDCSLTPGDPSPCGRCPECNSIAYLDRPKDRAIDRAQKFLKIVRAFVNPVEEMHGVPVRLDMNALRQDAEKLLKEIDGD